MKKMNITIENEVRQFAFVKGNRAINAKTVKAKENSIKEQRAVVAYHRRQRRGCLELRGASGRPRWERHSR